MFHSLLIVAYRIHCYIYIYTYIYLPTKETVASYFLPDCMMRAFESSRNVCLFFHVSPSETRPIEIRDDEKAKKEEKKTTRWDCNIKISMFSFCGGQLCALATRCTVSSKSNTIYYVCRNASYTLWAPHICVLHPFDDRPLKVIPEKSEMFMAHKNLKNSFVYVLPLVLTKKLAICHWSPMYTHTYYIYI